jgi:acylphosphatase
MKTIHIVVRGRVQGVCYRMRAQEEAAGHGLTGWVRNCPDGSVELLASGEPVALAQFRAWCARGPGAACVERVDVKPWPDAPEGRGFHLR